MSAAEGRRRVGIVATGDELSNGSAVDTNSAAIAQRLFELGFEAERFVVLGDDEDALAATLLDLASRCDAVVVTGGLGPTLDDVTRAAAARAAGVDLVLSERSLEELRAWFAARSRNFPASNERQAWFPRGAKILANPHGTAPGFACEIGGALVFALPGPPREMQPMLEADVVPRLLHLRGAVAPRAATLYLFGLAEGAFADLCGPWMARTEDPLLGVTARGGVLTARIVARGDEAAFAPRVEAFRARFAEWIFSEEDPDPAFALGRVLLEKKFSVAVAESCTGGLVAEKLTRVPGISAVFDRGFVTYSDRAKTELLGVDPALVRAKGAVSREVAEAMASGAAKSAGARLAVSVTGIAGPDGGSEAKPVGLVWFATARDGATVAHERRFGVRGRELIREFAANTALDLVRREALRD
jgi:nicotinamide-nucleotide amidase